MTLREALLAMGYREVMIGRWFKPVGFVLLVCNECSNELINYFKAVNGTTERYETKAIGHDEALCGPYLYQLKHFECFTRTDVYGNGDSCFELSAIDL